MYKGGRTILNTKTILKHNVKESKSSMEFLAGSMASVFLRLVWILKCICDISVSVNEQYEEQVK
jgi:hypothetical protein